MESKTEITPPAPQEPPTGLDLQVYKIGERYTGPVPTRFTPRTSDEALYMKASAIMESIRSRLDKKESRVVLDG